jgi:hypothetical protein
LEQEAGKAYEIVGRFIDPVLGGSLDRQAMWDPADHAWRKPD